MSGPKKAAQGGEDTPDRAEEPSAAALHRRHGTHIAELLERQPPWAQDFTDLHQEWRRLFSELFGTFLLVTVGAGAAVVQAKTAEIGRVAAVAAPGLLVMAVILFMGAVSGAHLNPVVSIAFALRGDFGWRRVPGYVAAQIVGAVAAASTLKMTFGSVGDLGATLPTPGFTLGQAFLVETLLTLGLVSTILGTASTAQNIGPMAALGVGGYIVLAGLWASPVSGASMNPARSLGPDLIRGNLHGLWPYLAGPLLGAVIAVGFAQILRGPGGDPDAVKAAEGTPPHHG
jgi:aquaporin Z